MKSVSLYPALLITILSVFLQGMDQKSSEQNSKDVSSTSLNPIEKEIFRRAIKTNSLGKMQATINEPGVQQGKIGLEVHERFYEDQITTDPLTQTIFDAIKEIEKKPKDPSSLVYYLGSQTHYSRDPFNSNILKVTMKPKNIKELSEICDSYKE
jgi:hypothetical protein